MPEGVRVGVQLLHDEIVVLSGFDVGAVLANRVGDGLECLLVLGFFSAASIGICAGATFHGQLDEGVTRAGGGRWPQHLDLPVGQGRWSTSFQV